MMRVKSDPLTNSRRRDDGSGIAEIYACDTEKEMVVLKNRKGFIRLALQTSTPIVPVYCLGCEGPL